MKRVARVLFLMVLSAVLGMAWAPRRTFGCSRRGVAAMEKAGDVVTKIGGVASICTASASLAPYVGLPDVSSYVPAAAHLLTSVLTFAGCTVSYVAAEIDRNLARKEVEEQGRRQTERLDRIGDVHKKAYAEFERIRRDLQKLEGKRKRNKSYLEHLERHDQALFRDVSDKFSREYHCLQARYYRVYKEMLEKNILLLNDGALVSGFKEQHALCAQAYNHHMEQYLMLKERLAAQRV